jgi:hypothetical protein
VLSRWAMCEESSMYYAEAIVLSRFGAPRRREFLDDPRVVDFLKSRDLSPWDAFKQMLRWLTAPAGRAL